MRKFGIIAAILALSVGTWFFMQKTSTKQQETHSSETSPAAPESPATAANPTQPETPSAQANSSDAPAPQDTEAPGAVQPPVPSNTTATGVAANSEDSLSNSNRGTDPKSVAKTVPTTAATSGAMTASVPAKSATSKSTTSAPVPAAEPSKNCFTFEYRHQDSAKSKDIESFLDFSNAFPLAAENVNKKSICVKVNQKPVEFQVLKLKGKEEIVLGPVVGPESVIRISYCTGTAQCRESCTPPKKRFMDDLLSDAQADEFQDSWGKGADANSQELKAKTKELKSLAQKNGGLTDRAMMRDWNTLQKQEWSCNQK